MRFFDYYVYKLINYGYILILIFFDDSNLQIRVICICFIINKLDGIPQMSF